MKINRNTAIKYEASFGCIVGLELITKLNLSENSLLFLTACSRGSHRTTAVEGCSTGTLRSSLKGSVLAVLILRASSSSASSREGTMSSTGRFSSSSVRSMKWTKKSPLSIRK